MTHYKQAINLIEKAKHVLMSTHQKPDGDALGSLCAFINYCEQKKISYTAITENTPEHLFFLPGSNHIKNLPISDEILSKTDLIIAFDFNEYSRSPIGTQLEKLREKNIPMILFDHHQIREQIGTINITNETASSTTLLIFNFFCETGAVITPDIATCLLTGIITDTDHLSNSSTTPEAIKASSDLMARGALLTNITHQTRCGKNIIGMKLWGEILSRLQFNKKFGVAFTIITQKDLEKYNIEGEIIEGIPNFLTAIDQHNAIMVLKEEKNGIIRGSFRTTKNSVDVSKLARYLGGGGHIKAAGFTVKGTFQKENNVWKII